jgi:hypothetical protein
MKKGLIRKGLVFSIIVLYIGVCISPTIGISNSIDDTTPPVTTITFDPPVPNGLNEWYVIDVNVTLNATDDISGVKTIFYQIPGEQWASHDGDNINFTLDQDCLTGDIIFYSVDYAENQETIKSASIDIDQLPPVVDLVYEIIGGNPFEGWWIELTATATDDCSGLARVEFYLNDVLQETVTGPGPTYSWSFIYHPTDSFFVRGIITNLNITDDFVNFYAIFVIISGFGFNIIIYVIAYDNAGNSARDEILQSGISNETVPGIYLFINLQLPNNYQGYIGKFFILANFFE